MLKANALMSSDEILAAEKAVADRQANRKRGYAAMHIRDQGEVTLSNNKVFRWSVPKGTPPEDAKLWVYPKYIPEGKFELDGVLYDAEEFRKWLRWC